MTEVEAPDGTIIEFPDTMSAEEIEAVMQREYPQGAVTPRQPQEPQGSPVGAFNEGLLAEMMAAQQGASPVTRTLQGEPNYPVVGELMTLESEYGPANTMVKVPEGAVQFDPETMVVFPEGGRMNVYQRTPEMEEGALTRAGRMIGLGALAPSFATAPARTMRGLTPPSQLQRTATQFERAGIQPRLPAITDAPGVRMSAQALGGIPFAGGPIKAGVDATRGELVDALGMAARMYGTAEEGTEGGAQIIRGAQEWFDNWKQAGRAADADLAKRFGVQPIRLSNFEGALNEPIRKWNDPRLAEMFGNERLAEWRKVFEQTEGFVSYEDLLRLRQEIGDELARPAIVNDIDQSQLRRFYGALSEDLRSAARAISPVLERDVIRRNNYWSEGFDRIDSALKEPLNPRAAPEAVFERIMQISREKGRSANIRDLAKLRRSVPKERWDETIAAVIARMATAPAGQQARQGRFSPTTFATNWNAMSPRAKNVLFGNRGEARQAIDNLVERIMPQLQRLEQYENVSRTGNIQGMTFLGSTGYLAGIPEALAVAVGSNFAARAMMNPGFTKWLARTATRAKAASRKVSRMPEEARQAFTANFWAQNLGRLRALAENDESLQPYVAELETMQ